MTRWRALFTWPWTEAALAAFCHSLRGEVADRGVRVTVAHPAGSAHAFPSQLILTVRYLSVSYCKSNDQNPAVNPPFRPPEGDQLKRP